ncbi:ABC transporter permease [Taibaiella lutea]|uniref:Transport permease protein n=1 Tax=Taibaiella lutea TaxID=2608001 RepID=A0A5M6CBR4_9BACT|nr:ABC transporter permease [Taibaiella lutea]KAA5532491.1 ABC transporter permease [Taibaiella lutea]
MEINTIAAQQLNKRPTVAQTIQQSLTMAYRGLLKVRYTPEQLVDVTVQPILFTLMFTYLFGGAISGNVHNYLPIIIPGILAQSILTGTVTIGVQFREDMGKGVFDRFRSLPIARIAPLAGALLADTIRYALVTILTFTMGYLMGYHPLAGIKGIMLVSVLVICFAWCVSWIFALAGVIGRSASSVQGISMMILFPLTFLSNAFVPANTLPSGLQWFVKFNPVSHLVTAIRELLNQNVIGMDFWLTIAGGLIILMIFIPLTVKAYMRKA